MGSSELIPWFVLLAFGQLLLYLLNCLYLKPRSFFTFVLLILFPIPGAGGGASEQLYGA